MKIYIIGSSGAGKTTLARQISDKLGIPILEIDRLWFKLNGPYHHRKKHYGEIDNHIMPSIRQRVLPLARKGSWVIEGNYSVVRSELLKRADQVILLAHPHHRRIIRNLLRPSQYAQFDLLGYVNHLKKVLGQGNTKDRELLRELRSYRSKTKVLNTFREAEKYLEDL